MTLNIKGEGGKREIKETDRDKVETSRDKVERKRELILWSRK